MENAEVRVTNDESKEEKAEGFVYHKVDLGPVPVIDYGEDTGGDATVRERASLNLSPKGTKTIAQGKAAGRDPGSGGDTEPLPEGEPQLPADGEASVRGLVEGVSLFRTRAVKEMLEELEDKPRAMPLFDDMWLTGEMAVCFGERGVGKSILAVQIAESIAAGKRMRWGDAATGSLSEPPASAGGPTAENLAAAQTERVLYFDFELSRQQFEARYCYDPDPDDPFIFSPHQFSPGFLWSEIDPCVSAPKDCKRFEDFVLEAIESEIKRTGAKVVIIDNIDRFNGEIMRARDIAYVMSRLKRLKAMLGLSILVLAHLPRRRPNAPLGVDRLMATRTLCAFADNVFAIGQSRWNERSRYLKHLKATSTDLVYDDEYVPTFLVYKKQGRFLSFNFQGFRREQILLDPYLSRTRLDRSDRVKELAATGKSQRHIAAYLDLSLGSVNRALNMWSPFDDRPKPAPPKPKPVRKPRPRPTKTAKTVEQVSKNGDSATSGLPQSCAAGLASPVTAINKRSDSDGKASLSAQQGGEPQLGPLEASDLTHSLDESGNQIWVEKVRESDGRRLIWYKYDQKGRIRKVERGPYGDRISLPIPPEEFKPERGHSCPQTPPAASQ